MTPGIALANSELDRNPAPGTTAVPVVWRPVPETLPPDPDGGWFSPLVWLALSDGRVMQGQCLHKNPDATYDAPVHSWHLEEPDAHQLEDDEAHVIAWLPFVVPDHPSW